MSADRDNKGCIGACYQGCLVCRYEDEAGAGYGVCSAVRNTYHENCMKADDVEVLQLVM